MRTRAAIACLVASVAMSGIARGGDVAAPAPAAAGASEAAMPASGCPGRWCIKSFIAREATASRSALLRRAPPGALAYGHRLDDAVADDYRDAASLLQRLEALGTLRFATLWRGRDRALVVGIQDGGYVGVSLDDTSDDVE